ncbi:MAG: class I SAM-dependent rRNA methyltransferase [Aureliella sp.]
MSTIASATTAKRTSHPNIFRKRISEIAGSPGPGDWVAVSSKELADSEASPTAPLAQPFAYGIYNPKSEVAIRLVSWAPNTPDDGYWDRCLKRAIELRCKTLSLDTYTDCYRVIHAEADGIPGLVVDRFGDTLSAEIFSAAIAPRAEEIVTRLSQRLGTSHWLIQPGPFLLSQEGFEIASSRSGELPKSVTVREGETRYEVHFESGHKTGFFCDQRDNRQRLAERCRGQSVLDVCCYTGGFAVKAAGEGKASEVTGVDLDAAPLELAARNCRLNGASAKFTNADAFGFMRDMIRNQRQFDIVVLDPPKLIRNRAEIDEGTRKHFDLNRLAMQLVRPGGLMLTCSCAGLLQDQDFTRVVRAAGRSAFLPSELNPNPVPRNMQIISKSGAAACHPVSANCPETEYLKSIWLRL